jgi:hypothetical protein
MRPVAAGQIVGENAHTLLGEGSLSQVGVPTGRLVRTAGHGAGACQ